jgi:hypothetical protein
MDHLRPGVENYPRMKAEHCRAPRCGGDLRTLLETGEHPVSNGYIGTGTVAPRKPVTLCQCEHCNLLQLAGTFSESALAAAVPGWVRYGEPEAHLDEVATLISQLLDGDRQRTIAGLTYIDQSLQDRLLTLGWENQAALDVINGASPQDRCSIETTLAGIAGGTWHPDGRRFDLLVARHVFDHVRDIVTFSRFARSCLTDHGLVMIEVPDSTTDVATRNPLMLWEGHASYFSSRTLLATLESAGLNVVAHRRFAPGGHALLWAVCKVDGVGSVEQSTPAADDIPAASMDDFVRSFFPNRDALRAAMSRIRSHYANVAMLGAGHIGNLFLNLHGLGGYLDCALDDDARKSGLLLPGSQLPIRPGTALAGQDGLFILMAVNPAIEERVIGKWRQQSPDAAFGSIFPQSPYSILRH